MMHVPVEECEMEVALVVVLLYRDNRYIIRVLHAELVQAHTVRTISGH